MYWTIDDINFKFIDEETGQYNQKLKETLNINMKLPTDYKIDLKDILKDLIKIDLSSGEQKLVKWILRDGNSVKNYLIIPLQQEENIHKDAWVKIKFEQRDDEGRLLDLKAIRQQVHKINFNSKELIIIGLKEAILSMKPQELAWFKIAGKYLQTNENETCNDELQFYYKIELVEFSNPKPKDPLNKKEQVKFNYKNSRFEQIEEYRVNGQKDFKAENFAAATNKFKRALNFIKMWPKKVEIDISEQKQLKDMTVLFSGNLAQIHIEMGQFDEGFKVLSLVKDSMRNTVIVIKKQYLQKYELKNYYRLAKCKLQLKEPEKAIQIINEAFLLCTPSNDDIVSFEILRNTCLKMIK